MIARRPRFAALQGTPFGHPPIEGDEDSAAGARADGLPPLTAPAHAIGAPAVASPLGSPWRREGKLDEVLLHGQIHERRVSEVAGVAAPSILISGGRLASSECPAPSNWSKFCESPCKRERPDGRN